MNVLIDGIVSLDCSISERHSASVEITKHPIEEGANPTDHAREMPLKLIIEGLVTNTPLSETDRNQRGVNDSETSSGRPGAIGHAQDQFAKLREILSSRRAITVRTAIQTYESMIITSIETPRDSTIADAFKFTIMFEQVRFVRSEVARLEQFKKPTSIPRKPIKAIDQTKKQAEEITDAEKAKTKESILFSIFGG